MRTQAHCNTQGVMLAHAKNDYPSCLVEELKDGDLLNHVRAAVPELQGGHVPSIEALAAYKDRMRIPDRQWHHTVSTFNLGAHASVSMMRKQRENENRTLPIQRASSTGYEIPLRTHLKWYLQHNPPPDPDKSIIIKFALDGANMTSGKRTTQELGGWQILTPGEPLALVKSPRNCHVFLIYIGGESEEELQESLANTKTVQHPNHRKFTPTLY